MSKSKLRFRHLRRSKVLQTPVFYYRAPVAGHLLHFAYCSATGRLHFCLEGLIHSTLSSYVSGAQSGLLWDSDLKGHFHIYHESASRIYKLNFQFVSHFLFVLHLC